MTRVPPPWIIEEADLGRRRREEGKQPRLEIPPPPPPPARSGEDEPEARVIVIDLLLQESEIGSATLPGEARACSGRTATLSRLLRS